MSAIRWLALLLAYSVLECAQCLRVTRKSDNGIKLIIRPGGARDVNPVTNFVRERRQASANRTRMGKVWMLTEGAQTEVETVPSWDVSEDNSEEFILTTDRLAYILIGSCCVISIVCLLLVLIGLRCHRKCTEKRKKKLDAGYIIYPTANCYRIRSYSDAHFYQVPVYNEGSPYPTSCVYCKGYPYYYKGWKTKKKELNLAGKRSKYQETKKSNIHTNSALHEQTLDIRGKKTVKRITVLPPAETTTEPKEQRRRDSKEKDSLRDRSSVAKGDDNPWIYSRRNSKTKKEIRINTLTDNERDAWLNCIYLLDELHRCHASSPHLENTDMSTSRHASARRSSQDGQEKTTHAQRVFFSEPSPASH